MNRVEKNCNPHANSGWISVAGFTQGYAVALRTGFDATDRTRRIWAIVSRVIQSGSVFRVSGPGLGDQRRQWQLKTPCITVANEEKKYMNNLNKKLAEKPVGKLAVAACALPLLWLSGCGGGGGGNATLSGSLSGLAAGLRVALQVNSANDITLASDQAFSFPATLTSNRGYKVTVLTQPVGQTCTIQNSLGSVDSTGNNVSGIAVTCVSGLTIRGTVTGLAAGASLVLSNTAVPLLPVSANGAYGFPGSLAVGSAYAVTVSTQPALQICTLANATGIVVANVDPVVTVSCV